MNLATRTIISLAALLLLLSACSSDDQASLDGELASAEEVSTDDDATDEVEIDPIEQVAPMWTQTLDALASGNDVRETAIGRLPISLPADAADTGQLWLGAEPIELTSNATYRTGAGDSVIIADCAFSDTPTLLGNATAGFEATAISTDDGWEITELDTVAYCIPAATANEAANAYEQFRVFYTQAWEQNDPELPGLAATATPEHVAKIAEKMAIYEEEGWVEISDIEALSVEPIRVTYDLDGRTQVHFSRCVHLGPNSGSFELDTDGEPGRLLTEVFGPYEERWRGDFVMVLDGDTWLYDGFSRFAEPEDCLLAPTDIGAPLL